MDRGRTGQTTMRRGRRPLASLLATATAASGLAIVATPVDVARAATVFTVTTTQHVQNPALESPLRCSLQEALTNAINDAQTFPDCPAGSGDDIIEFNIPGDGPHEIDLTNASLGSLSGTLTIDGTTQPGWSLATPKIVLDGQSVIGPLLDLAGTTNATVRGLALVETDGSAGESDVLVDAGEGSTIEQNWIGLAPDGTGAGTVDTSPGSWGVRVRDSSVDFPVTIENNVIAGHDVAIGVIGASADDVLISGNRIGTDVTGQIGLGNATGIAVGGPEGPAQLTGLVISDNVISANSTGTDPAGFGVRIGGSVGSPRIVGNQIGTDVNGADALPNDIGIGLGVNGSTLPQDQVTGAVIGSPAVGEGNRISGNLGAAIVIGPGSRSTLVQSNVIGVDNDSGLLPNNTAPSTFAPDVPADGEIVIDGSSDNTIGGVDPGAGNQIAIPGSTSAVRILSGARNLVTRNEMSAPFGLGIDLGAPGADPNDPGDGDAILEGTEEDPAFANNLQNSPVITGTSFAPGDILQIGVGLTSDPAFTTYPVTIEVYTADGGAGAVYIGATTITEPAFTTLGIPGASGLGITGGTRLVALAIDDRGNTSEFSASAVVEGPGTFVVNSLGDDSDGVIGDGICSDEGGDCTLRAAIQEANANSLQDTIAFGFPGTGPVTITPATTLPTITTPIVIDGLSVAGASCASWPPQLRIAIDTSNSSFAGLFVDGVQGRLDLRGVALNGSPGGGGSDLVFLGGLSTGNEFRCNFFGTDITGTVAIGQSFDQIFANGSDGNTFGGFAGANGNLFAGNVLRSHLRLVLADDNVVVNNTFGTDVNGSAALGTANGAAVFTNGSGNDIGVVSEGAFGNRFAHRTSLVPVVQVSGFGAPWPTGNSIRGNRMFANAGIGIDLRDNTVLPPGDRGVTFNHFGVLPGPNEFQNFPVLTVAQTNGAGQVRVAGFLDTPLAVIEDPAPVDYVIDVYANRQCDLTLFGEGERWLGEFLVTAVDGRVVFDEVLTGLATEPEGITATATNLDTGSTSEFSYCRPASTANTNWVQAQLVMDGDSVSQFVVDRGMEKWFRLPAGQGADVSVTVTGLPGSAVSIHSDPLIAYSTATNPSTVVALAPQAADVAFLPSGSLPSGSLPSGSLPSGSLPSGSLPSGSLEVGFLPSGSLPSGSLPSGSLPSGSLPSGSLPSGSLPSGSLPSGSLPSGSLPSGSLPSGSLPSGSLPSGSLPSGSLPSGSLPSGSLDAYATASRRSLIAYSANPWSLTQSIQRNTFDEAGDIWIRVVGPYNITQPFTLEVDVTGGVCGSLGTVTGTPVGLRPAAGLETVILTDSSRLTGTPAEIAEALADLRRFATRSDVRGVVVDLADPAYARVQSANARADAAPNCAFAKNTVAEEIKAVVDAHRPNNPGLRYVVIAGGAEVIPFHQVPDVGGLANEKEYIPPVAPNTPTDAGLRSGLVKGQDFFGSATRLTVAGRPLDVPGLAVGRLVDGAADVSLAIEAYEATDGVVTPSSSLVTGYDFVGDAAATIAADFRAGIGNQQTTLIQPVGEPPTGPNSWNADQLRAPLLSGDNDVIMLTGHFSAGKLLAADYRTTLLASEIQDGAADYADTIVLALGCHGGFSLPSTDLLAGASPDPDWAKAFLRRGVASFVAASGYAYGDTELEEYGERLFIELARAMRTGTGPIPMGEALVAAKRAYIRDVPQLTGLDEKTIVEMTLYGLPMMKVDVPGTRLSPRVDTQIVTGTSPVADNDNGLRVGTPVVTPAIVRTNTVELQDLEQGGTVVTQYSEGRDGLVVRPFEPVLPKQVDGVDAPAVAGTDLVLRGVALRGGTYSDASPVVPFTSAPTTERSRPIQSFRSDVFFPTQVWSPNFYDAIEGGVTRVVTIPQQYRSNGVTSVSGTLRTWDRIELQTYYLPETWTTPGSNSLAAGVGPAPSITGASGDVDGGEVVFSTNVVADGSAGVQAVWVLVTGEPGSPFYGRWSPIDLVRDDLDPSVWTARLALAGADPSLLRFMVQAVGGAGLTTLDTNLGAYYRVGVDNAPPSTAFVQPTTVELIGPSSTSWGGTQTFSAVVRQGFTAVSGAVVDFEVGGQRKVAVTNGSGVASVDFTTLVEPGTYTFLVTVRGSATRFGTSASQAFVVDRAPTTLTITGPTTPSPTIGSSEVVAELTSGDLGGLGGKFVVFTLVSPAGTFERVIRTDTSGIAVLGDTGLPPGTYSVSASFGGAAAVDVPDTTFGPSTSGTVTLQLADLTAPTITAAATTVTGGQPYVADTWTRSDVTVTFTCRDTGGSGVASCTAPQTVAAEGVTPSVTGEAVDGAGTRTPASFGPIRIDRTGPVITVTSPAANASFPVGAVVNASYTCVDAGVGGGTCAGPVPSGQRIDTATPGSRSFVVNATDALGNTSSRTVTYTVVAANAAPVVIADMGVNGLQEIGFRGNAVLITGTFTDADGPGPYRATAQWTAGGPFTPFAIATNGRIGAAFIYPSAGVRTVTIRVCDARNNCGTDTITVRTGITQRVTPVVQCVRDRAPLAPRYRATFGYNNPAPFPIAAPTIPLFENWFLPLPAFRGQPQVFLPGNQRNVFTADFTNGSLTWILHGTSVTARTNTPRC